MTATDEPCDVPHLPYFWTHDDTLHIELPKLPESIFVRLPDQRDREVGSARTWQYTQGSGTCHDEGDPTDFCCSECGARMFTDTGETYTMIDSLGNIVEQPNFCPNCGAKVVDMEACQVDTNELDSGHVQNLSAYETGYRDGSVHYELDHCPACKNIADLQEALSENAKLRELVRDMHKALFSLNLDHCQACPREDACLFVHKSFDCDECAFERDMRELRIEANDGN